MFQTMIRRASVALIAATLWTGGAQAETQTFTVDPAHTTVGFSVRHMMISTVSGKFQEFDGVIELNEEDLAKSKASGTIQVASIDTDNQKRDNHLRSPDFFNAEKYPTIQFETTEIRKVGDKQYEADGTMTIRDVTKPITLDIELGGIVTDPWGNRVVGLNATTEISRSDFGMTWNKALETGGVVVGDTVTINLDLEAKREQ